MATTVAKLKTGVGDMKPTVSICALIPLLALGGHQLIRCTSKADIVAPFPVLF
jgi:hypothetical protein